MNKTEKQTPNPQLQKTPVSGSRFVPMLFSTDMVQAILNGTKTETRRIVKFKEAYTYTVNGKFKEPTIQKLDNSQKSKVDVGDIIWVRETFSNELWTVDVNFYEEIKTIYKASDYKKILHDMNCDHTNFIKWKPSLFMPKDACRLFLKCTSLRVQRLQDIDEQSSINEGIENLSADEYNVNLFRNYLRSDNEINYKDFTTTNPIASYQTLWQKINGKDSWDLNPYVFVYKFERIERPHDFR